MAKETLLDSVPLPRSNIHRIPAELAPELGASRYQAHIRLLFSNPDQMQDGFPIFDLILLGMGDDGHTASLFPNSPALLESRCWVVPVSHKEPPLPLVDRITLTLPVINAAAHVIFLVSGEAKAGALNQVLSSTKNSHNLLPAALVQPHSGNLTWYLDQPASMMLEVETGSSLTSMRTSLIIPALNEAESLEGVLQDLSKADVHEIILVDGGSSDNTVKMASDNGARILSNLAKVTDWHAKPG